MEFEKVFFFIHPVQAYTGWLKKTKSIEITDRFEFECPNTKLNPRMHRRLTFLTVIINALMFSITINYDSTTVCIKKRLVFEIQISHNVLNLPDKYNCLESFSEP